MVNQVKKLLNFLKKMQNKKISVIGMGYVGLPTALNISSNNFKTTGVDIDLNKIKLLQKNQLPFKEKGIKKLLNISLKNKNINFTNKLPVSDIYIVCVPTPLNRYKNANLNKLWDVIKKIKIVLKKNDIILIESTIPIGTTKEIYAYLSKNNNKITVGYVPERAIPGNTLYEIVNNHRIIGLTKKNSKAKVSNFYKNIVKGKITYLNDAEAEMVKLFENTSRDVNIALANEFETISKEYESDITKVIKNCNYHPRVNILDPGIGVGGHCIPVDPWFLISNFKNLNTIRSAREMNNNKENLIFKEISKYLKIREKLSKIYVLGLTYKPNCNDLRESPAIRIANKIKKIHRKTFLIDPNINLNTADFKKEVKVIRNQNNLFIFLVAHNEFFPIIKKLIKYKIKYLNFCGINE